MKSPEELAKKLARQWEDADLRESRLLTPASNFPISLSIGKPAPSLVTTKLDQVKRHVEDWRSVKVGRIRYEAISYRATANSVEMPVAWELHSAEEWVRASNSQTVTNEYLRLSSIVNQTDPQFHRTLVRQRSLSRGCTVAEIVQAAKLALALEPGCAQGKPLRTISLEGIDTKFFERNQRLMTTLLDVRFDGEVSRAGLVSFLDAAPEAEHWLLVADLDGSLLPFRRLRITASELRATELPASRILIIENERCLHQLPKAKGTIAILGCGFDLTWTDADWLRAKQVAYWGDIDTWGLELLAKARERIPNLAALLMSQSVFDTHKHSSVPEPVSARAEPSHTLSTAEQNLYRTLLTKERGRLEQEFLPPAVVHQSILDWIQVSETHRVE